MRLNEYSELVNFTWNDLPNHISNIRLDAFVVMTNHAHGIIVITDTESTKPLKQPQPLPEIVRPFKTFSAQRINQIRQTPGIPVWQRNYWDRIIRDESELNRIGEYIINNPRNWYDDEHYV